MGVGEGEKNRKACNASNASKTKQSAQTGSGRFISHTSVLERGFQFYMLANKLEVFVVVVVYKARREERDRSVRVVLVFLSRDLRLRRTPLSQPTLPPAKAPVIWIFLFNEGDFKGEGGLSCSRERRKALSAGSPTMFGPFFTTTEQCQAPPHNCSACVLTLSFRGRHFANARYLLF